MPARPRLDDRASLHDVTPVSPPLVSVVTVARDDAAGLARTLASVRLQDHPRIQHIVIDGASRDGTRELLARATPAPEWLSEPDDGPYDAMNKGLRRARGDWVVFMNAGDCFACPDALAALLSATGPGVALVSADYLRPSPGGGTMRRRSGPLVGPFGLVRSLCHQAILFRRSELAGGYDVSLRLCADLDVLLALRRRHADGFRHVDRALVVYEGGGLSERDYAALHAERERVVARHFGPAVRLVNRLNHLRIRAVRMLLDRP